MNLKHLFCFLSLLLFAQAQFYTATRTQIQGNEYYYEDDLAVYQTELFKTNDFNQTITYPVGIAGRAQVSQSIPYYDEFSAISGNTFSCVTENTIYSIDLKTNQTLPVVSLGYVGRALKLYAREPYILSDGTPLGQFIVLTSDNSDGSGACQLYSFVVPSNQILMNDVVPPAVQVFPDQDFEYVAATYSPITQMFYGVKPKPSSQKGEPITQITIQALDFSVDVYSNNFTNKVEFEETTLDLPAGSKYNQVVRDIAFVRTRDNVLFLGIQAYNETQDKYDDFNNFKPEHFSFASINVALPISQWTVVRSSVNFELFQVLESAWDDVNEMFVYLYFGDAFQMYDCSDKGCTNGGKVQADQYLNIAGVAFDNYRVI